MTAYGEWGIYQLTISEIISILNISFVNLKNSICLVLDKNEQIIDRYSLFGKQSLDFQGEFCLLEIRLYAENRVEIFIFCFYISPTSLPQTQSLLPVCGWVALWCSWLFFCLFFLNYKMSFHYYTFYEINLHLFVCLLLLFYLSIFFFSVRFKHMWLGCQ